MYAIFMVHITAGHPFVNPKGASYELAADYLAIVVAILLCGPGAISADALLFGRSKAERTKS